MATSQNGWHAATDVPLRPLVVAGESFSPGILDDDDVHTILGYVAQQMHERVEPIVRSDWHQADDWGFYYRSNRNANDLSNHSSGTAIDYNATRHPNGVPTRDTFTHGQIAEVHQILDEVDGVVRWGGDYSRVPDAMHFEINAPKDAVARAAAKIRDEDTLSWDEPIARWDGPGTKDDPSDSMWAGQQLNQARGFAKAAYRESQKTKRLVKALAKGLGPEVEAAVEEALKDATIDVNVNVNGEEV